MGTDVTAKAGAGRSKGVFNSTEACDHLGVAPVLLRWAIKMTGICREKTGQYQVLTREDLDRVDAYLTRCDPEGEFRRAEGVRQRGRPPKRGVNS